MTETQDIPKELGLIYVVFLTDPLCIQWDQFIIFQVTLLIKSHQMFSNFLLVLKSLHLNLSNIVVLFTLKVFLNITLL